MVLSIPQNVLLAKTLTECYFVRVDLAMEQLLLNSSTRYQIEVCLDILLVRLLLQVEEEDSYHNNVIIIMIIIIYSREREREREKETDRQTETQTDRQRQREKDRDRQAAGPSEKSVLNDNQHE